MPQKLVTIYSEAPMGQSDIDRIKAEISLQDAASRCGFAIDPHGAPPNVRLDCPFNCPGDHTGKREISTNIENPDKVFRCHAYECHFRGNLIHLMHGWLTGQKPPDGKVRGEDFKRVKAVLLGGTETRPPTSPRPVATVGPAPEKESPDTRPKRNIPLAKSESEKARELVGMEDLFVTSPEHMSPECSAYWRRRPYLTDAICEQWGVGVRPTRAGADKRGWSLRNQICYRFLSEDNQTLCYVGRNPKYERELRTFEATPENVRLEQKLKAPMKHRFPKRELFRRGLELYGQHSGRFDDHPEYKDFIAKHGVIVVEGFNDVLALDALGVPAVAICSNRITEEQAAKVIRFAKHFGQGRISLMFDCEGTGDDGAKEALWLFSERGPDIDVRLAWSQAMHGGQFAGRQPESLSRDELHNFLLPALRKA